MGRNAKNILNNYDFYPESVWPKKLLSQRPCSQDDLFPCLVMGCGGSLGMPWGLWFCVLGHNPVLFQPPAWPLCLLVSARQLRHMRAAGCVASGHLYTLPLPLHPPPPVAHEVLVAHVRLPVLSEKPLCCRGPGLGTFLSPVLWGKVKQATNLIWSLFSTHNSSCKERRGRGGRMVEGGVPWTPCDASANLVLSAWEMFTSDLRQRGQN